MDVNGIVKFFVKTGGSLGVIAATVMASGAPAPVILAAALAGGLAGTAVTFVAALVAGKLAVEFAHKDGSIGLALTAIVSAPVVTGVFVGKKVADQFKPAAAKTASVTTVPGWSVAPVLKQ